MTLRHRLLAARLAYVAIVLIATLAELHFSPDLHTAGARLRRAFLPAIGWSDAIDGLRNVALFAGLGVLWVVTSVRGHLGDEIRRATLVGLALSATVEGLQVFSPVRTASIADLITNTLGAAAGAVTVAVVAAATRQAKGARSYLGVPAFLVGGAYGLAVLCEALTPLMRSEPMPAADGGPLARLQTAWSAALPLSPGQIPLSDPLLFAPAGFLAVMLFAERGKSARWMWAAVAAGGAVLAFAAELGHGGFGLSVRWEAAATNAVAFILGAWAAHRWLARLTQHLRGAARARAAIAAYVILLFLWGWRPFLPELDSRFIVAQIRLERFLPLLSLSGRADVFSAVHVAQAFLLFVPLGALLAVWPARLHGRWSHLWPAVWTAAAIEVGHLFVMNRFFDITNALVGIAGAGVAWLVVRRSGYAPYGESFPRVSSER
ncbi:MAG: VanZ family protein [Gemmatimonadetes bacterium]|nr:VanZ family protein [Gemmatimonadota bacterium]